MTLNADSWAHEAELPLDFSLGQFPDSFRLDGESNEGVVESAMYREQLKAWTNPLEASVLNKPRDHP